MVFAEQGADWVPDTLRIMDNMYYGMFRHERARLSLSPKKYFKRQCFVEAMFLGRREVEMRHAIGVENMLWGSDYPHYEGTWPHSRKSIEETLSGVPDEEVRKILSENAAPLYGFDLDELDAIASAVGPELPSEVP